MSDILLLTPPFTQLNTPYPATAYLKGFLQEKGKLCTQLDLGIEVINTMFSKTGLQKLFDFALENDKVSTENASRIITLSGKYINTIDSVVVFLQEKNSTLARQIVSGNFLPRASRFDVQSDMHSAFGSMGLHSRAKYSATLYLEDLSDFIQECVDPNFGFSRYAESLGRSANSFETLYSELQNKPAYVERLTLEVLDETLKIQKPKMVCFSIPFPGNLFSAFRCAQFIKQKYPEIKIVAGGGFPNTELRSVSDPKVFEFFDFIVLDDGERPLELIVDHILNKKDTHNFKRTFLLINDEVKYIDNDAKADYAQCDLPTPDYSDLPLDKYISLIEMPNPMHTLWSDGRWNKLLMAHGCYWGKCAFCDGSLSYIKHYDPLTASKLVDRMEQIVEQTGETGFHFVDEAAPPKLMIQLALEILKRKLVFTWWANVRFERNFTVGVCALLKLSGCIAVSGGLEVASDRLLKLINKGVTVEQVAKVSRNFAQSGIMVHAYLMYGFPSQTVLETVDSLEMVRQMFQLGIVQSGFWHRFALTAHSPVGLNPEKYNIAITKNTITFANNDVQFVDKTGIDHDIFSFGLKKALYNYMHGICFELPLQEWFEFKIPKTSVPHTYISDCIETDDYFTLKLSAKLIWTGSISHTQISEKTKKGRKFENLKMIIHSSEQQYEAVFDKEQGQWLERVLPELSVECTNVYTLGMLKDEYEKHFDDFQLFWFSKPMRQMKASGLLIV